MEDEDYEHSQSGEVSDRSKKRCHIMKNLQTSLARDRTATTSGQSSPVRPSRSLSKRLVLQLAHPGVSSINMLTNKNFGALKRNGTLGICSSR